MSLQYRIAPEGQVRDVDDGKRQVQVVIPWEVIDSYNTDFARDCFDEWFAQRMPVMCWQHQRTEPIGRVLTRQAGSNAHEMVAQFSDFDAVPRSRQAFAQIRDKEITDFSFGFDQAKSVPHPQTRGAVRFVRSRMPEISPVTIGSIPGAVAVGIRAEAEVANVRGLLEAGAIDEDAANEMLRAAGLDPLPRQRVEVSTDPLGDAIRAELAKAGERDLVIRVGSDGTVSTDNADTTTAPDDGDTYDKVATIGAIDGAIDAALSYTEQLDLASLPDAVGMVVQLLNAADVAVDELMQGEGIPDYDDTADGSDGGMSGEMSAGDGEERATLSTSDMNSKPDEDFAYIEPGGTKDDSGKTVPRSKRHFYIGDAAHVRDALGRIGQGAEFGDKALPAVKAAAKKFGIQVADDSKRSAEDDDLAVQVAIARMNLR